MQAFYHGPSWRFATVFYSQRITSRRCHDLVIRRHVLAALAAGVEAGDDGVAREALAETEWILRGPARRRLERALIDAAYLTREGFSTVDPETMRHLQRVAALDVARRVDVDVQDRSAVARAYYELEPDPIASTLPLATALATGTVMLVLMLFVWLTISVRTPAHVARPEVPMVTGAYFHGGEPRRDDELAAFLANELTALVIETDSDRQRGRDGAVRKRRVAELRDASVIASRGPGLAKAWRELIDALDRWVDVSVDERGFRTSIKELGRYAQNVSEQFAALGLGYYISADVILRGSIARAVIFSYQVEDVAFVRAGGDARRVLSLRRLDRLNLRLALLGRQGDELGDPVVLLDQIDNLVVDRVLPVLQGETYRLGDPNWRIGSPSGRLLAANAAMGIERELRAALGPAVDDPERRVKLAQQLVTSTVRRHEARHGIDTERSRPLRYPARFEALVGARGAGTIRAELELAAYLSQIANDPVTPQFSLWNIAGHAFNTRWGSAESYVAVAILEGLMRQLGKVPPRPLVRGGHLDREALAMLALPLASQHSETLRQAARALWIEFYGEPLVPIVDVD
jgi:hypothetical protein